MVFHSTDEKLDYLESICGLTECDDETRNILAVLSEDACSEVRMRTCEKLFDFCDEQSEKLLLLLSDDEDGLVRCEACISLQTQNSVRAFEKLLEKCEDSSYLVRGYAAMSAVAVAFNNSLCSKDRLKARLTGMLCDKSEWVITAVLSSLVRLSGEGIYEERLLNGINSEDYRVRSFVLTLLEELFDENKIENTDRLTVELETRLADERNRSVYEKTDRLLKKCKKSG